MATDQGGQPRRPIEPLVGVVTDGVALGYEALELVVEGLRESLRIQTGAGQVQRGASARPRQARGRSQRAFAQPAVTLGADQGQQAPPPSPAAGAAASSGALIADLAGIASELLTRAGAVAAEVATAAGTRSAQTQAQAGAGAGAGPSIPELILEAPAGKTASCEFQVWNTGPAALRNITLNATDLIGAERTALDGTVTFKPPIVDQLGPGKNAAVEIDVAVPKATPPGNYRGLVQAEPGDTCAVLLLCVVTAAPRRAAKK